MTSGMGRTCMRNTYVQGMILQHRMEFACHDHQSSGVCGCVMRSACDCTKAGHGASSADSLAAQLVINHLCKSFICYSRRQLLICHTTFQLLLSTDFLVSILAGLTCLPCSCDSHFNVEQLGAETRDHGHTCIAHTARHGTQSPCADGTQAVGLLSTAA